jgi:hypothetical protein
MIMQCVVDSDWSCSDVLRLSGVCALWKEIAEQCGQLWHKLFISSPGSGNSWGRWASRITSITLVEKFLRNSHFVPLHITISITPPSVSHWDHEHVEPAVYALVREVLKHATRWRTLELLVEVDCPHNLDDQSNIGCIHQIYSLLWETGALATAHKLVELFIRHVGQPHSRTKHVGPPCPITTILSDRMFQLHHLRFDAFVGSFPSPMLRNVTRLSIGDSSNIIHFQEVLSILDDCPVLEDLTIRYFPCRSRPSTPPRTRNLKAIHFIDTPYPEVTVLWFSEPTLETIEVLAENYRYHAALYYQSFISLMGSAEALSQIRHLDVGGATMANIELQQLVTACSSAIRVSFRASSSDEARTGILRHIRLTIRDRLLLSCGQKLHVTLVGWTGVGKTNRMALEEWKNLKMLASSASSDGHDLWF